MTERKAPIHLENKYDGANQMEENQRNRIFLCHAKEDKATVLQIYERLLASNYDPWMDERDLLPGQDFEKEIRNTLNSSKCVFIFFSNASVKKRGFVQKEFKHILGILDEIPSDEMFIIPIRLNDCVIPDEFSKLQWVNYENPDSWDKILKALSLIFGGSVAYQQSRFFSGLVGEEEQRNEDTLKILISKAEIATKKSVSQINGTRQLQLFIDWSDVAKFFSEEEPLMHNTWVNVLKCILNENLETIDLIYELQYFQEEDAEFLMRCGRQNKMKFSDEKDIYTAKLSKFSKILMESKYRLRIQMAVGFIPVLAILYGSFNFVESLGAGTEAFIWSFKFLLILMFSSMLSSGMLLLILNRFLPTHDLTWLGESVLKMINDRH